MLRLYRATDAGASAQGLSAVLRPLDRPALVLWGAHDPYLSLAQAELQRRTFPRAQVIVLPNSGHWPFIDDPGAVESAIGKFLERVIPG